MLSRSRKGAGLAAEDHASAYLEKLGWQIVERNWRCRSGEIDLVARDQGTLVFVEVRSRTSPSRFGTAIEAVTPRKCQKVRETAGVYLRLNRLDGMPVRFDAVAVTFAKDGTVQELKHIPNAF